jgi:hypothetical protein
MRAIPLGDPGLVAAVADAVPVLVAGTAFGRSPASLRTPARSRK